MSRITLRSFRVCGGPAEHHILTFRLPGSMNASWAAKHLPLHFQPWHQHSAALFYQAFCMNRDECRELFLLFGRTYWKKQFMNNAAFTSAYNASTKWWLYFKPSAFRTGQRKHKTLHCVPKQLKIHILAKRTFKKLCCICLVWYNKYQPSIEKLESRREVFWKKTNHLPPPIRIWHQKNYNRGPIGCHRQNRHTYRRWFKTQGSTILGRQISSSIQCNIFYFLQ